MGHQSPISGLYWVSGFPHLLREELSPGYKDLATAAREVGKDIKRTGAKRILYYSTQWLSVLGVSFQAGRNLKGEHVDENWHDLVASLPFDFKVDRGMAEKLAEEARGAGFQPALIDFVGFPVDTATIVADSLINEDGLCVNMVSSHVYADAAATRALAASLAGALEQDNTETAIVVVSGLSGYGFTDEIDLREDRYRDEKYRRLDEKLLALWQKGSYSEADDYVGGYGAEARADMGLKAYHFLRGFMGSRQQSAEVLSLAPVNGQGAAVIKF